LSVQSPLPVVVVTGLHQAQRRRAVRELLATTSAAVVLHHDLSRAGHGEVVLSERRVAAAAEWDARYGDRIQLLTFTAQGLDADGTRELLDSCLLTDEELAAGEACWKTLPDAFGELLDPVP
jgi:hypothetical protein